MRLIIQILGNLNNIDGLLDEILLREKVLIFINEFQYIFKISNYPTIEELILIFYKVHITKY